MSFFSKLFGGNKGSSKQQPEQPKILGEEEYHGYLIQAIEYKQGDELLLAGNIIKQVGQITKSQQFIRSDRMINKEQALTASLAKGRQIIDQNGDHIFSNDA